MCRRLRRALDPQDGFTIVEVIGSLTILALGFLALAGTLGVGSKLLVQGTQRQVAAQEAARRLEAVRHMPYDQVLLPATPVHAEDTKNPDFYVQGSGFDPERDGSYETLVVDATAGQVTHLIGPAVVGSSTITTYQYVTWVDDPTITGSQDYKRVTIVVTYDAGANPGRPNFVQTATLLTPGTVIVGGQAQGATQGSGSGSSPTPTPTPTGSCSGDVTAPTGSFTIISATGSDTGYTASQTITLSLAPSDGCGPITVEISNDNSSWSASIEYDASTPTSTWTLTAGDGLKSVWVRYGDGVGNKRVDGPKTVTLDMTLPTVPGTLADTVSCQGNDRTVSLSWGTATDANLLGYRVYKRTNGGAWAALLTTAQQNASDTDAKNLNSLDFKVVAYDRAGNEGNATNVVSLAKNQCS